MEQKLNFADIYSDMLRAKFKKGRSFLHAISHSILCGEVWNEDVETGAYIIIGQDVASKEYGLYVEESEAAIIVTPDTNIKVVKWLFQRYKDGLHIPDTINNIVRDRKWYWMKQSGLSYQKILDLSLEAGERISRDGVVKAIKQYREHLV